MATLDISPVFRTSALGMDRMRDPWRTTMSFDSSGYPAYDLLKVGDDEFRISLALAGWTHEEITVETRDGNLWVKGERQVDPNHNQYLFKGIAFDGFQRSFQLPEHVKVRDARLENGLLHIDLVRELPEAMRPHRIEVKTTSTEPKVLANTEQAA